MIDIRQEKALGRSIEVTREIFGKDSEIYAVGFSIGSNLLLRHLGMHEKCEEKCSIKAAVSISGAFDLASVAVDMRQASFGLYDRYVLDKFKKVFSQHRFKL